MTARKKMAREERAKQFMPFAALKGYTEALRREEEYIRRSYEGEEGTDTGPEPEHCSNSIDKIQSI